MNLLKIYSETSTPGEVIIDDTWYSPGVVGFLATFGLAAVSLLIVWDLVRRIRRVRYRAEISDLLDKEQATDGSKSNKERPAPPEKPLR
jgi:Ni/Fe-hydrogenase subunit HybB-like protein